MKKSAGKKGQKKPAAVVVIILIACAAIALAAALQIGELIPDKTYRGNTASNIANGGMAVMDELSGDVYYSNNGIFVKKDDEQAYMLSEQRAQSMVMDGEKLYFCNMSDAYRCYSINTDGTGLKKLNDEISAEYLNVQDGRIYFACIRQIDKRGIYSMNTDGSDLKKEADAYPASLILYKNYFYYLNKEDSNRLYMINRSTGVSQKITSKYTYCPIISVKDNKLYYSYTDGIYSASLDGGYEKLISQGYANKLALTDDGTLIAAAFSYQGEEGSGIYAIGDAGKSRIRGDEAMWLSVCGDKLYFMSLTQGFEVMRCDLDGQNGVYIAGGDGDSMLANIN